MKSVNDKILVTCDIYQKEYLTIGDIEVKMATSYEINYRERSPVIAIAEQTKGEIVKGDILITHHNHFYEPSPYWLGGDKFSIPYNHTIFAIIDKDGKIRPICGNMFVSKIDIPTTLPLPPEQVEQYKDKYIVTDAGRTPYRKGQFIFTRFSAGYEIVYNFNNTEGRVIKINSEMVLGYI